MNGIVFLLAIKVSWLCSQNAYLWNFAHVILVTCVVFCVRFSNNVRRFPNYLTNSGELNSSRSMMVYGFYRHHLLNIRYHENMINHNEFDELTEYMWYEGQIHQHYVKCCNIECPCSKLVEGDIESEDDDDMMGDNKKNKEIRVHKKKVNNYISERKSIKTLGKFPTLYNPKGGRFEEEINAKETEDKKEHKFEVLKSVITYTTCDKYKLNAGEDNPTADDGSPNIFQAKETANTSKDPKVALRKFQVYLLKQRLHETSLYQNML